MDIKTFGVVGAGQMGNGIAQVAAMSGLDVVMNDIKTEFVERGLATITKILTRSVDKGKMTDDDADTLLYYIAISENREFNAILIAKYIFAISLIKTGKGFFAFSFNIMLDTGDIISFKVLFCNFTTGATGCCKHFVCHMYFLNI